LASIMGEFKYFMFLFFPFAPIIYGLIIAPAAFAYHALVPSKDRADIFD
jgi:hypothetical protein